MSSIFPPGTAARRSPGSSIPQVRHHPLHLDHWDNPYIPNRNTLSTKVKVDIMFERTLQDLIRGLRAHKASSKAQEDAFIQEAMVEIREELKGKDMALKGEGIIKMCYVSLLRLQNARSRQKLIAS